MEIVKYECPRADCQNIFPVQTDSNCRQFVCPECYTKVKAEDIVSVGKINKKSKGDDG